MNLPNIIHGPVLLWFISYGRFYLGGPTSVRGFGMYCIGPQSEGQFLFTIVLH